MAERFILSYLLNIQMISAFTITPWSKYYGIDGVLRKKAIPFNFVHASGFVRDRSDLADQ
jgi:hypothetical protein